MALSSFYYKKQAKKLSLFFIIAGSSIILFASIQIFWHFPAQVRQTPNQDHVTVKPQKLYIPKLAKTLSISDGYITDNRWTISQTGVSYLVTSATPGSVGNSVIYGHNLKNILGDLPKVTTGDLIYVILDSGQYIKYQVSETKEVGPNQVEILRQSTDSRLTIYTCSGFLDQARFVLIAQQESTL